MELLKELARNTIASIEAITYEQESESYWQVRNNDGFVIGFENMFDAKNHLKSTNDNQYYVACIELMNGDGSYKKVFTLDNIL